MNKNRAIRVISSIIQEKIGFSYLLFTFIVIVAMILQSHKVQASSSTSTVYLIDITDCIKCYNCHSVANHSIGIEDNGFPYWLNGLTLGNFRILTNPPSVYLDDLQEAIEGCPMECISKSIHQKRK